MGEKIMYGKIILSEQICNITSIMNQNNKGAFNVVQGYTVRETAEILNAPQGTVSSKLHRTLKKLRADLEK